MIRESELNRMLTRALIDRGAFVDVRSEVWVSNRLRADIVAEQPNGHLALFELKARPLRQPDIGQVIGYARCLERQGYTVHSHLVGYGWPALVRPDDVVFLDWSFFAAEVAA